jgi:hypothetical protein
VSERMGLMSRFAQVRRNLMETVSRFPEDKVEEEVCGGWDIQCVLAHMAGWDAYFALIARRLRTGEEVPFWGDNPSWGENMEKRNEGLVKEREGRTREEVQDEFVKAGGEFLGEYSNLEEKLWNRRFWTQRNPTPAWVVKHNVEHYEEHLHEIEKKLKEWEGPRRRAGREC